MASNKSQVRKIESMTRAARVEYLSTADRVTIGTVSQVFDRHIKTFYVAKIRGVIVGNPGEWKHETVGEAREYGRKVLKKWRADFEASKDA